MPYAQRKPAAFRVAGRAVLAVAVACGTPHDPARDRTLVIALAAEPTLLLPPLIAETPGFVIADQILERLAEPDSTLSTTGKVWVGRGRSSSSAGQGWRRVCSNRNLSAHRATVAVERATCL